MTIFMDPLKAPPRRNGYSQNAYGPPAIVIVIIIISVILIITLLKRAHLVQPLPRQHWCAAKRK